MKRETFQNAAACGYDESRGRYWCVSVTIYALQRATNSTDHGDLKSRSDDNRDYARHLSFVSRRGSTPRALTGENDCWRSTYTPATIKMYVHALRRRWIFNWELWITDDVVEISGRPGTAFVWPRAWLQRGIVFSLCARLYTTVPKRGREHENVRYRVWFASTRSNKALRDIIKCPIKQANAAVRRLRKSQKASLHMSITYYRYRCYYLDTEWPESCYYCYWCYSHCKENTGARRFDTVEYKNNLADWVNTRHYDGILVFVCTVAQWLLYGMRVDRMSSHIDLSAGACRVKIKVTGVDYS